ncbi:AlpA family phage regulatory protein [Providencia stuartii]|uniref:helix-turn-helix transcriptional regulator n=1 Tax=Providencia TaxID=586 RepID=UPI0018CABB43|nr:MULTISPECIES: AlpA family phage regulatory protein [Providencia]MBQ0456841.1 AlpA family phage regulatory protein [Providencia stuartii]MBQ0692799.1 AlpA family phage regulatory protein [Providencia stuartii]QPN41880.1 AlpA family phage regulatory protein [Providencia sp. 2.29]WAZ77411.1 AlpA family phage regulatory protein [Providencia stuartii]WAZ81443.1 AlpA family phage regulatory protein [Providencia stuartii]
MNHTTIKVISMAEVMALLGYKTRNSIYDLERKAGFPPRIHIGIRRIGYDFHLVQEWIQSRTNK